MPGDQLQLLLDNPELREAASVLLEQIDSPDEELQWSDVSGSISSGQWGRLIQEGVLVSGASGFVLSKPERLRAELAAETGGAETEPEDIESTSWTGYDKVAGLATLLLFFGYWNSNIRDVVASVDDIVLTPVTSVLPFYAVVLVLAIVTGLYSTVLQDRLTDTETIQKYRDRMDRLEDREEAAKERDDEAELEAIQEEKMEAAKDQLGMFKAQFRPMVWIMLLTIPVFLWLRWKVRGGHMGPDVAGLVVPLAGHVGYREGLIGPMSTWIVWYFLCSMASRQFIRKVLGVKTTPQ